MPRLSWYLNIYEESLHDKRLVERSIQQLLPTVYRVIFYSDWLDAFRQRVSYACVHCLMYTLLYVWFYISRLRPTYRGYVLIYNSVVYVFRNKNKFDFVEINSERFYFCFQNATGIIGFFFKYNITAEFRNKPINIPKYLSNIHTVKNLHRFYPMEFLFYIIERVMLLIYDFL